MQLETSLKNSSWRQVKWSHALFLFAVFPLLVELILMGVMFEVLGRLDYAKRARMNSIDSSSQVCRFLVGLVNDGTIVAAKELADANRIAGKSSDISSTKYAESFKAIDKSFRELIKYLSSDPRCWDFAESLQVKYVQVEYHFRNAHNCQKSGDTAGEIDERLQGTRLVQELVSMSRQFVEQHSKIAANLEQEEDRLKYSVYLVLTATFAMSLLCAGSLAYLLNRTIAANLRTLTSNVQSLAEQKEDIEPLKGNDEFATVDAAFRRMFNSVTEVQHTEKMMVESAADLICSMDRSATVLRVNSASKSILDYEPEQLIGVSIFDIIAEEEKERATALFAEAVASKATTNFELRLLRSSGHTVDTAWSVVWSQSEETLFCVAHDLSQRKQAERVKQEITAMISHDLRTPINSLQVAVELFARGTYGEFPDGLQHKLAASTAKAIEAMDLINDLLDIEKLEQSTIDLSFETWSVRELIESAWRDIEALANERNISLSIEGSSIDILVDREQFVRVLRNLLRNSATCASVESTVVIRTQIEDDTTKIRIEDSGPLVSADEREYIFDRFQSTERVSSKRVEGMGLSLAVCKALVTAQGGELSTGETPDGKFFFLVSLPN
ncbi:MAG: hypothetical protein C0507_22155 [Cyanobacteria bacterium PR.3.49]|nr:hypothetical protein [Cyanobacteria bacterium PR.3.49]